MFSKKLKTNYKVSSLPEGEYRIEDFDNNNVSKSLTIFKNDETIIFYKNNTESLEKAEPETIFTVVVNNHNQVCAFTPDVEIVLNADGLVSIRRSNTNIIVNTNDTVGIINSATNKCVELELKALA